MTDKNPLIAMFCFKNMEKEKFIKIIKQVVHDSSIAGTVANLKQPPGRRPSEKLKQISAWYNEQSESDKKIVNEIITQAVYTAIFGFLCVIDGTRAIESESTKGFLELIFKNNGDVSSLTSQENEMLHDIYQFVVQN